MMNINPDGFTAGGRAKIPADYHSQLPEKSMNQRIILLCAVLCVGIPALGVQSASAQTTHTVVGSAAISAAHGQTRLTATVGQSAIGPVAAASMHASQGFWFARPAVTVSGTGQTAGEGDRFSLASAPNPFSRLTTLSFPVPERTRVSLVLFNTLGAQVRTLLEEEHGPGAVTYEADFSGLPSGVYTAVLRVGNRTASTTLLLVE